MRSGVSAAAISDTDRSLTRAARKYDILSLLYFYFLERAWSFNRLYRYTYIYIHTHEYMCTRLRSSVASKIKRVCSRCVTFVK